MNPRQRDARTGTQRIIFHHTVNPSSTNFDVTARRIAAIQNGHMYNLCPNTWERLSPRWSDIGYHFLIDIEGRIWRGTEIHRQGIHTNAIHNGHYTNNDIGIALIGDFWPRDNAPWDIDELNPLMKQAMRNLSRYLVYTLNLRTTGTVEVIDVHSSFQPQDCPGDNAEEWILNELRPEINRWLESIGR